MEDGATCGLGRYCNDRLHPDLCNAVACLHDGRVWLKAIMDIFPGDEITIYYGWEYWRPRANRISAFHADQICKLNESSSYYSLAKTGSVAFAAKYY